jgi:hypothetical protein
VVERGKHPDAISAITLTVSQQDGVKAAPVAVPAIEAPKVEAKPEPVVEKTSGFTAVASEEIPEPVKVKAKQEEPSEKSDLTQLLAEWDDD